MLSIFQYNEAKKREASIEENKEPVEKRSIWHYRKQLSEVRRRLKKSAEDEKELNAELKNAQEKKKLFTEKLKNIKYCTGLVAQIREKIEKKEKSIKVIDHQTFPRNDSEPRGCGWKCYTGIEGKLERPYYPKSQLMK